MSGLFIIIAVIAALVVFDVLVSIFGVDSRPETRDPRAPVRGITI